MHCAEGRCFLVAWGTDHPGSVRNGNLLGAGTGFELVESNATMKNMASEVPNHGADMTPILQAGIVAATLLGSGATAVSVMNSDVPDLDVPALQWSAGGDLDGRVVKIKATIRETGEALEESELTFSNGMFQSSRCQQYCEFGWNPYQTWSEGDTTHFTATTICPDAPHTVVWYGTVTGDEVTVAATWTTRRWYWTQQINVVGEGALSTPVAEATSR